MLARFDHRPRLTALLALSTTVLVVVVVTLATLLITAPPAATPSSVSDGGNAGKAAPANHLPHRPNMAAGGESYGWSNKTRGGSYRWNLQSQDQRARVHDQATERHAKPVSDNGN